MYLEKQNLMESLKLILQIKLFFFFFLITVIIWQEESFVLVKLKAQIGIGQDFQTQLL